VPDRAKEKWAAIVVRPVCCSTAEFMRIMFDTQRGARIRIFYFNANAFNANAKTTQLIE
jgi:hypothetical protein